MMNKNAIRKDLIDRLWEKKEYKKANAPFDDKSSSEYRGLKNQISDYLDFLEKLKSKDYIPQTGITEEDFVSLGVNYINRIYCYKGDYSCREISSYLEKDEFEKLAVCLNFLFSHDFQESSALCIEKSIHEGEHLDKEYGETIVCIRNCLSCCSSQDFLNHLNLIVSQFQPCMQVVKENFIKEGVVDPVAIENVFVYFEDIVRLVLQTLERIKPYPTDDIMTPIKNNIFSFEKEFFDKLSKYK